MLMQSHPGQESLLSIYQPSDTSGGCIPGHVKWFWQSIHPPDALFGERVASGEQQECNQGSR